MPTLSFLTSYYLLCTILTPLLWYLKLRERQVQTAKLLLYKHKDILSHTTGCTLTKITCSTTCLSLPYLPQGQRRDRTEQSNASDLFSQRWQTYFPILQGKEKDSCAYCRSSKDTNSQGILLEKVP